MRIGYSVLFFVFCIQALFAQTTNRTLVFDPDFGNSRLVLDDSVYKLSSGDSLRFETLKFYISRIEFFSDDKSVWKEERSFHLIDVSDEKSLHISLPAAPDISFNKIKFNLGIDSITNVSGAMGGDLDPTKGMYWTWQSGYINFKLEGKSNVCKTRNNEFQFHLGGYQSPFSSCQEVILNFSGDKNPIIMMHMEKLMNDIDLLNENQIMSPGKEAVLLSKKAASIFSINE